MDLTGRHFLKLLDYTPEEINYLIDLAAELKRLKKAGIPVDTLRGKNVALIFEKTSTRTRCAFEVAGHDLGMGVTHLDPTGSQIGKKESIADTARVLSRMFDGIEYRGFGQSIVEELAQYADVPVWNGLTNEFHPTQILADFLTIQEHCGGLKGKKLVYMGDARYNMGNSLMIVCAKLGLHFVACAPKKYFPNAELVAQCEEYAKESGATITLTEDVKEGTKDALDKLKEQDIKVRIFTGDNRRIANKIADELEVKNVEAEMLPADKYNALEKILKKYKNTDGKVAFVGDGINDSPVLALADVGISMGGVGANSAIEASDVVIMTDSIDKINEAIEISKKTSKIIKQNLIFAIATKIVILVLSTIGIAGMWQAVFADVGVTLITILNTLRILK